MSEQKPKSTFQKVTKIVVWTMLILTIGSLIFGSLMSIM